MGKNSRSNGGAVVGGGGSIEAWGAFDGMKLIYIKDRTGGDVRITTRDFEKMVQEMIDVGILKCK